VRVTIEVMTRGERISLRLVGDKKWDHWIGSETGDMDDIAYGLLGQIAGLLWGSKFDKMVTRWMARHQADDTSESYPSVPRAWP
jgi:hypothetical protein